MRSLLLLAALTACSEYDLKRPADAQPGGRDSDPGDVPGDVAPDLVIAPETLDFGGVGVGCEASDLVTLTNEGDAPLSLTGLTFVGDGFTLDGAPAAMPQVVSPGERLELTVGFAPTAGESYSAELRVDSNDPDGQERAAQVGEGALETVEQLDTWSLPEDLPVDILFSTDSSCSMTTDLWQMYNNFDPFVNLLESLTGDWQIMVANEADGCNHSTVLAPYTPDYVERFQDALFAWNWEDDYTEALLTVNDHAIQNTDAGECNAGFLRDGAMLHIIDISDEPEQSPERAGRSWDDLIASIVAKKGDPSLTTISAIAGDVPHGCSDAAPGDGYWEATQATGGVFLSICYEWYSAANLQLLAEASVSQSLFVLSAPAVEDSIQVEINGQDRVDWVFDAAENAVTVTLVPPGPGDRIAIEYLSPVDCD